MRAPRPFVRYLNYALEELATGKTHQEKEHVFYGRMVDPQELETKATGIEHHEQWSIKVAKTEENATDGQIRVRKTEIDGQPPEYTLCTKTKDNDDETVIPCTVDMFLHVKRMSEFGMIKTRYTIPIEGSDDVWEIDRFPNPAGGYWDWVKVDLEVNDLALEIPPIPVRLEELIVNQYGARTDSEIARIDSLMKNEFKARNDQVPGAAEPVVADDQSKGADTTATDDPTKTADTAGDTGGDPAKTGDDTTKTEGGDDQTGKNDDGTDKTPPEGGTPPEGDDASKTAEDDKGGKTGEETENPNQDTGTVNT